MRGRLERGDEWESREREMRGRAERRDENENREKRWE